MDKIDWKINRAVKSMIYEGFNPGSLVFALGKLKIVKDFGRKYTTGGRKETALKGRLNYLIAKVLSRFSAKIFIKFLNLPSFFYPVWYRIIDGHKFTIKDGEKNTVVKHILEDYKLVKSWEPNTQEIIKREVKRGDICVDIGASMGPISLALARATGENGKVVALEPTERCFNYLCMNIKANGYKNIFPYKVAGWDKDELVEVPRNDFNPIYANGVAVSKFLQKIGIYKVDFIKIDVDGPEPLVLRGLIPTFEANPQLKMIIEFYPKYIEGAGCDPKEFWLILDKYFIYKKIEGDYTSEYYNLICERK